MDEFFRYPQTPHIAWLGPGAPRDDKVLSAEEATELLSASVVVEEKLDGANLGFSLDSDGRLQVQNRGQYLTAPFSGQFRYLSEWIALRGATLTNVLGDGYIVFGEWCAARHSLHYLALPDWWLMFDVYDRRKKRFWSTRRRDAMAGAIELATVPRVMSGRQTVTSLRRLINEAHSHFRDGPMEGVVVRREDDDWLLAKGKLVRPEFIQSIETHWRNRRLVWNQVRWQPPYL